MKRNDLTDIDNLYFQNYENLFNVYKTSDGGYYYNISRTLNIPTEISKQYCQEYVTKYGDTWTGMAYALYNDVKLWWIICIANGIRNPLLFPEPGTKLFILDTSVVQNILMTIRDN